MTILMSKNKYDDGSLHFILLVTVTIILLSGVIYSFISYSAKSNNFNADSSKDADGTITETEPLSTYSTDTLNTNLGSRIIFDDKNKDAPPILLYESIKNGFVKGDGIFSGKYFSFDYPTDWVIGRNVDNSSIMIATDNYMTDIRPNTAMTVKSGMGINVTVINRESLTIADYIKGLEGNGTANNAKEIEIDGSAGYVHDCFDFCYRRAVVVKGTYFYTIEFYTSNQNNSDIYENILNSLRLK